MLSHNMLRSKKSLTLKSDALHQHKPNISSTQCLFVVVFLGSVDSRQLIIKCDANFYIYHN